MIFKRGALAGLRRRHRGAHQRGYRRPCRLPDHRQAHRLRKELLAPHSLTMTMIGAALLWVGWFGLQRRLEPRSQRLRLALAHRSTPSVATAAAGFSWMHRRVDRDEALEPLGHCLGYGRRPRRRHAWPRASPVRWARSSSASWLAPICFFACHDHRTRSATTTASTSSASTALAASSAPSRPASSSTRPSAASASPTTKPSPARWWLRPMNSVRRHGAAQGGWLHSRLLRHRLGDPLQGR